MKKLLLTLTAVATILAAIPVSASAQPSAITDDFSVTEYSTMEELDKVDDVMPDEGEFKGSFYYEPSYGNEIRFHLNDTDNVGMTIKIYNEDNKQVSTGKTTKGNKFRLTKSFRPSKSYKGFYRYIIVPKDGGSGHKFEFAARAF
ncbi:hypothetical protein [Paenibacillus apiarius]|uniref:hypothetical protein n=1 Tax=Paenibacillus apiarius TaxID=46240 RepID=UPI0019811DAD|nr:hypothetical protein [Paenibacillus apiarius]MBN3527494.1 hypothetical protein [Paenibacillus apiarius]